MTEAHTGAQKANKLKNLLQAMRKGGLVAPQGPRSAAVRHLVPAASTDALDK
jgi:hypothetical protein